MADTRSTPKATEPATGTAAGLGTTGTAAAGGETRAEGILKAGKDEALTEAKAMVREAADEQRRRAAGAVGGVAGALHRAASDLEPQNEVIGRYTHMAAQRLDEVADYLRKSSFDDVLTGAEDLARRQPYWFVGGAMAAGFLLARMVKSGGLAQERFGGVEGTSQRLAASSTVGYGTSTEAGTYPAGPATTSPISSAGTTSPSPGGTAAGGTTPRTEV